MSISISKKDGNKIMDGTPKDTPFYRSPRFISPNSPREVNVLIISNINHTIPITARICETGFLYWSITNPFI